MRPPVFWQDPGPHLASTLLAPLTPLTAWATRRRLSHPGWRAPVPVLCCGNIGVGGAGKTTLALDVLQRLRARGIAVHALTRGHGGAARGVLRVDPARHDASLTGDEALLLAACAPAWVARDRAAAARAAIACGAECLVMDDGMQNPGLIQDCTLLVIDGQAGFGNRMLLPAGPLRESVASGAARARAAVLIGDDRHRVLDLLPLRLPALRASLRMAPEAYRLRGRRVVAFAGIGRPEKFFEALDRIGIEVVDRMPFPDHHRYRTAQLERLVDRARSRQAVLVTTPKDFVRLPRAARAQVTSLGVGLQWNDEAGIETILDQLLA